MEHREKILDGTLARNEQIMERLQKDKKKIQLDVKARAKTCQDQGDMQARRSPTHRECAQVLIKASGKRGCEKEKKPGRAESIT